MVCLRQKPVPQSDGFAVLVVLVFPHSFFFFSPAPQCKAMASIRDARMKMGVARIMPVATMMVSLSLSLSLSPTSSFYD